MVTLSLYILCANLCLPSAALLSLPPHWQSRATFLLAAASDVFISTDTCVAIGNILWGSTVPGLYLISMSCQGNRALALGLWTMNVRMICHFFDPAQVHGENPSYFARDGDLLMATEDESTTAHLTNIPFLSPSTPNWDQVHVSLPRGTYTWY